MCLQNTGLSHVRAITCPFTLIPACFALLTQTTVWSQAKACILEMQIILLKICWNHLHLFLFKAIPYRYWERLKFLKEIRTLHITRHAGKNIQDSGCVLVVLLFILIIIYFFFVKWYV